MQDNNFWTIIHNWEMKWRDAWRNNLSVPNATKEQKPKQGFSSQFHTAVAATVHPAILFQSWWQQQLSSASGKAKEAAGAQLPCTSNLLQLGSNFRCDYRCPQQADKKK